MKLVKIFKAKDNTYWAETEWTPDEYDIENNDYSKKKLECVYERENSYDKFSFYGDGGCEIKHFSDSKNMEFIGKFKRKIVMNNYWEFYETSKN
jgi:hypothetical protein